MQLPCKWCGCFDLLSYLLVNLNHRTSAQFLRVQLRKYGMQILHIRNRIWIIFHSLNVLYWSGNGINFTQIIHQMKTHSDLVVKKQILHEKREKNQSWQTWAQRTLEMHCAPLVPYVSHILWAIWALMPLNSRCSHLFSVKLIADKVSNGFDEWNVKCSDILNLNCCR